MPVSPIIVTVTMVSHCLKNYCNMSMVRVRVEQLSVTTGANGTALNNSKMRSSKAHT